MRAKTLVLGADTSSWDHRPWGRDIDLVCSVGGAGFGDLQAVVDSLRVPVIGVTGLRHVGVLGDGDLVRSRHIDDEDKTAVAGASRVRGSVVVGVAGVVSDAPLPGGGAFTQDQYAQALDSLDVSADVVVSHSPALGINDGNGYIGIEALSRYLDRCSPRLLIHAGDPVYLPQTFLESSRTEVVCVSDWALRDFAL